MTTIGYGDVAPKTGLSKLILCIFALMGAGFIAMPAVSTRQMSSLFRLGYKSLTESCVLTLRGHISNLHIVTCTFALKIQSL